MTLDNEVAYIVAVESWNEEGTKDDTKDEAYSV